MLHLSLHGDTYSFIAHGIDYGYIAYLNVPMNLLLSMFMLRKKNLCASYIYYYLDIVYICTSWLHQAHLNWHRFGQDDGVIGSMLGYDGSDWREMFLFLIIFLIWDITWEM